MSNVTLSVHAHTCPEHSTQSILSNQFFDADTKSNRNDISDIDSKNEIKEEKKITNTEERKERKSER